MLAREMRLGRARLRSGWREGELMDSMSRRKIMKRAAGSAAFAGLFQLTKPALDAQGRPQQPPARVNTNSAPSNLKITDMRALTIAANYDYPVIKIDTNQGVYGLGEVRDAGGKDNALIFKGALLGQDPLKVEQILRGIRSFSNHGRAGGGYSAIDIALNDIRGKVLGAPLWKLLGEKKRDKVRVYCDTTSTKDIKAYEKRMRLRKQQGFTFFKMDLQMSLVTGREGAAANGALTDKGLAYLCEFLAMGRDVVGKDVPLACDHFGRLSIPDAIRLAKAMEPYKLAWAEDIVPWTNWRGLKQIKDATETPINTGEDIFGLQGGFDSLIDAQAVDIIHPDPGTSGGAIETKRIADAAFKAGMHTAIHMAGGPVNSMATAHMAATLDEFLAMECHAVDMPWWQDLVTGPEKPIVNQGYIKVPDAPGIGVELNEAVVKKHLRMPGYFEPTPEFNNIKLMNYHAGEPWPHFDDDGNWCDNCASYQ
jgi:L-alanine-DL-glutamate epimerase-like enolase superfamily enzyme